MKTINEYCKQSSSSTQLNEYLLGKSKLANKLVFPRKPDYDAIVEFLENEAGFEKVTYKTSRTDDYRKCMNYITDMLEKSNDPLMFIPDKAIFRDDDLKYTTWIRFANPGKVCETNPIALIRIEEHGTRLGKYSEIGIGFIEFDEHNHITVFNYEDMLGYINKYFGW